MKVMLMDLLMPFCVGLILWGMVCCRGASVNLLWEPSQDARAMGYAVYYGRVGALSPSRQDVGNVTNATIPGLQPGLTHFFYCTAYGDTSWCITVHHADETSGGPWWQRFSSPLQLTNTFVRLSVVDLPGSVVAILRVSQDRVNWQEWWRETATAPRRFWKVTVTGDTRESDPSNVIDYTP